MLKTIIAPSILSADFATLGEDVASVIKAGADRVHFDVMDNHYVPNLTIGPAVCQALRNYGIKAPIDVHLMVQPVDKIIPDFAKSQASSISFHPDASHDVANTISLIQKYRCQVGLVLNPTTSLDFLDNIIGELDFILLMTVNPGFAGQEFIPSSLNTLQQIYQRIKESKKEIHLGVDGGVTKNNITSIAKAGANMFVAGSAIFAHNQARYQTIITEMRQKIQQTSI